MKDAAENFAYDLSTDTLNGIDKGVSKAVEDKLVELSKPPQIVKQPNSITEFNSAAKSSIKDPKAPSERHVINERLLQIELALFQLDSRLQQAVALGDKFNDTALKLTQFTDQEILQLIDTASKQTLENAKVQANSFVEQASNQALIDVRAQSILFVDDIIALLLKRLPTAIENLNELIISIVAVIGIMLLILFTVPFLLGWYLASKSLGRVKS